MFECLKKKTRKTLVQIP